MNEETQRLENGGTGLPGEGMTQPPGASPAGAPAPARAPAGGKDFYDAADEPVPHATDEEPAAGQPPGAPLPQTETLPPGEPAPPPAGAAPQPSTQPAQGR